MSIDAPVRPALLQRAGALLGLALLVMLGTGCGLGSNEAGPEQATFAYVIPSGAGERIDNGEPLDILPRELVADLDETIEIVNHDSQAHLIGPWFVGAGETLRQRFTVAGVFDGACSVHPSGDFTVIVNA